MSTQTRAFDAAKQYAERIGWVVAQEDRPRFTAHDEDGRLVAVRVAVVGGFEEFVGFGGARTRNRYRQEGVSRFDVVTVKVLSPDRALLKHERDVHAA